MRSRCLIHAFCHFPVVQFTCFTYFPPCFLAHPFLFFPVFCFIVVVWFTCFLVSVCLLKSLFLLPALEIIHFPFLTHALSFSCSFTCVPVALDSFVCSLLVHSWVLIRSFVDSVLLFPPYFLNLLACPSWLIQAPICRIRSSFLWSWSVLVFVCDSALVLAVVLNSVVLLPPPATIATATTTPRSYHKVNLSPPLSGPTIETTLHHRR